MQHESQFNESGARKRMLKLKRCTPLKVAPRVRKESTALDPCVHIC